MVQWFKVFGGSDKEEQKELFTKMYGKFDSSMYKFMINKFDGKINEALILLRVI